MRFTFETRKAFDWLSSSLGGLPDWKMRTKSQGVKISFPEWFHCFLFCRHGVSASPGRCFPTQLFHYSSSAPPWVRWLKVSCKASLDSQLDYISLGFYGCLDERVFGRGYFWPLLLNAIEWTLYCIFSCSGLLWERLSGSCLNKAYLIWALQKDDRSRWAS